MKYYELQGVKADNFTGFSKVSYEVTSCEAQIQNLMEEHGICTEIGFCDECAPVNPQRRCYDTTYWYAGQWYTTPHELITTDAGTVIVSEKVKKVFEEHNVVAEGFIPVDTVGDLFGYPVGDWKHSS